MSLSPDELEELRAQLAALTRRVHHLEQTAKLEPQAVASSDASKTSVSNQSSEVASASKPVTPASTKPDDGVRRTQSPRVSLAAKPARSREELESRIGKLWLNRIGISALLVGISYFIKYAFDNGWIGPAGRIALGLVAGAGVLLWSERFRNRGYGGFSYSLKALGIGILYLSIWGASQIYHLIPLSMAFGAMVILTSAIIVLAFSQDAEIIAAFSLAGGFSTPLLLSSGRNREAVLFVYISLLDLAVLAMVARKPWPRLLFGGFLGTAILYAGWYSQFYEPEARMVTLFFLFLFGGLFAIGPLVCKRANEDAGRTRMLGFSVFCLINAAAAFLAVFAIYSNDDLRLGWYALGMAAGYSALSVAYWRRFSRTETARPVFAWLHAGIALSLITLAVALMIQDHWITFCWLLEAAVLLLLSRQFRLNFARYGAMAVLTLGVVRLLAVDSSRVSVAVFNLRLCEYLLAIVILAGLGIKARQSAAKSGMRFAYGTELGSNLLALVALTLEVSDYFGQQISRSHYGVIARSDALRHAEFARNFSYSALWIIYGAALMMLGFWRRSAFTRWQALALIAFTIGKVFLYDVSMLQQGYRILSFIALGLVLMGISYVYHRDWLKLSNDDSGGSAIET